MRVLERNPLCLHLASKPRLCCFGRGAPHIWNNSRKKRGFSGAGWILHQFISRCQDAASQVQLPPVRFTVHWPILSANTLRLRLRALLNWVVIGWRGATPLVSLVTACIICSRRSFDGLPLTASPTSSWCTLGYWHTHFSQVAFYF